MADRASLTTTFSFGSAAVWCGLCFAAAAPLSASDPVSPGDSLSQFQLDNDLAIELAASEPDVTSPVFAAFDPAGRMWVVEMHDYPNGPPAGEPGRSRIRILTDPDGDGRFSAPTTFAEGLLFANSLMFWKDGVLVTTDGRLDFLADRDGDGRAEFRETWFQGFARENPQLRCNHPTLGLDGWISVANGLRGGKVVAVRPGWPAGEPIELGSRDFRFHPETGQAETISGFGQFGMSFDDYGRRFLCSNRNPGMHAVLPESALRRNPDVAVPAVVHDAAAAGEASRIFPISRFWTTSNLHAGQFTAACGVRLFRGNALPAGYAGNLLTCDPTGNLIHREVLAPNGATFTGANPLGDREFLATRDTWFRPVNMTVGPDGALYVVDMYRAVIEHPEYMPEELKTRPDLTLGNDRGRIYRITSRGAPRAKASLPAERATSELVTTLAHPNGWHRDTAFRLLLDRPDVDGASLRSMLGADTSAPARTLAAWLLANRGELREDDVRGLLDSGNPDVVEQGVVLTEQRFPDAPGLKDRIYQLAEGAPSPRLRFVLALGLGAIADDPRRPQTLATLLRESLDDPWTTTAVAISSEDQIAATTGELLRQSSPTDAGSAKQLAAPAGRLMEVIGLRGQPAELAETLAMIQSSGSKLGGRQLWWTSRLWQRLATGLRSRGRSPADLLQSAAKEAGVPFEAVIGQAAVLAQDATAPTDDRIEAIRLLEFSEYSKVEPALTACAGDVDQEIVLTAVATLDRHHQPEVTTLLVTGFSARSPAVQREVLTVLTHSDPRIAALLDAVDADEIPATALDANRLAQLARVQNPELQARVARLIAANQPADRSEVLSRYQTALETSGDPLKGRTVFSKNCVQCHRVGDLGVNVAPDISDSRVKQPAQLLTDILDPNRAIDNNYFNYTIVDRDGVVHTGIIAAETATSISLRQPENKQEVLPRNSIESVRSTGQSLMPVGLEKTITPSEMADLISFIKNWRYLDGQVPKDVIR